MRHTYYDMKGNEHTIEIPDEYIESKRQQAILKASAANLYLLEHGIEVGNDGKIRFILNSKTYEMSMVCKRKPKAK